MFFGMDPWPCGSARCQCNLRSFHWRLNSGWEKSRAELSEIHGFFLEFPLKNRTTRVVPKKVVFFGGGKKFFFHMANPALRFWEGHPGS